MPKLRALTGKVFDKLTVIGPSATKKSNGENLWECQCTCGNRKFVTTAHLTLKRTTSCGCNRKCGRGNCKWKGTGEIAGKYWSSLKNCARARGISFDLNIEDIWKLFLKQNRKCAISGVDLSFGDSDLPYDKKHSTVTASLDRIDSKLGYCLSNVHWCHKTVNLMKRDMPIDLFYRWCSAISSHQKTACPT